MSEWSGVWILSCDWLCKSMEPFFFVLALELLALAVFELFLPKLNMVSTLNMLKPLLSLRFMFNMFVELVLFVDVVVVDVVGVVAVVVGVVVVVVIVVVASVPATVPFCSDEDTPVVVGVIVNA
jgi:hypothetical protein